MEAELKRRIGDKTFALIKTYTTAKLFGGIMHPTYLIVFHQNSDCTDIDLTPMEAREVIEEYGLVEALYDEKLGQVWDTPSQSFRNKFEGYFSRRRRHETA